MYSTFESEILRIKFRGRKKIEATMWRPKGTSDRENVITVRPIVRFSKQEIKRLLDDILDVMNALGAKDVSKQHKDGKFHYDFWNYRVPALHFELEYNYLNGVIKVFLLNNHSDLGSDVVHSLWAEFQEIFTAECE